MDIVQKLRARKAFALNGTWMMLNQPDVDCEDAACEIERLRAALKEIAGIEDEQYGTDWCEIEKARDIANAALTYLP